MNDRIRDEYLNIHWFFSLEDAKMKDEKWGQDYYFERLRSALNSQAQSVFATQHGYSNN